MKGIPEMFTSVHKVAIRPIFLVIALFLGTASHAEVVADCGSSTGYAFFLKGSKASSDTGVWVKDGKKEGRIILLLRGPEDWDIQFNDILESSGYRREGAKVVLLQETETLLQFGAFHADYTEVYIFDFSNKEVVWTSSKTDRQQVKVASYHADC
jgi:hypothetical protein